MPKVLISDKLSQNAVDVFAAHGVDSDVKTGPVSRRIVGHHWGV
jgi:hypothetical protein